ncbi:MAG TPA: DNA polymerase III subunit delta [Bdellovibrionota bacterium]|nr:DNA polymerase III subunit delta [Bdellovibrionota bacterium]
MNPRAFTQQLEGAQSKTLYLFYGECHYLINKAISRVSRASACRFLNAKNDKKEVILNALQVSSGLFGQEILVVRDADHFKKKEFSELFNKKNESAVLILVSPKKLDFEQQIFKLACYPPYENEMADWIFYLFNDKQKKIESAAIQTLAHLYGRDLDSLAMEVEKIMSYVGTKISVSEADVLFVTRKTKEHPIFHLLQGWGGRPLSHYLDAVLQLKISGEAPLFIFNMIVRECRKLLEYKNAQALGLSDNEILRKLKVTSYFGRALVDQANRFSLKELQDITQSLATFDYSIKSGKVTPWSGVEAVLPLISKH